VRRKRFRHPALDYVAYLAVRLLVCIGQLLTVRQSYALADVAAKLLYRLDARHRRVAMENLAHAFGGQYTEAQRDAMVRGVYRHFCRMIMEMLHIPRRLDLMTWRRYIRLVGHEPVLDRLLRGGPLILLSGHFGNWEMAGYTFGAMGFPPSSVARVLDNPHLDRFLRRFRERTGQRLIAKKGGYEDMLDVLRNGGVLSFLADQDAGERGLFVEFFGRPASTHKAIALLAIEYRAPIVVGYARRLGDQFRYEVGCAELIEPSDWESQPDPVRYITQRYTAALERIIRESPEQYLWLHRRWKHQPKPRPAARRPHLAADPRPPITTERTSPTPG
jgi:KDO2-lipid IV(A) lauroyltransferase